ncbi:MAG: serine hydroxymethyltransferase [Prochlorococcus sp. SP3034]|nr:serine hydroxymethyltransferase [Prochlorococcus sp. SP3034]|tara:strand:- start:3445 stop:3909 length:465 start_codon:yes stop_codon:yes gene_type:complete
MEFILFISSIDKEILELIKKLNYSVEENASICLIGNQFVGFHKKGEREIIICTKNAKHLGKYKEDIYIQNNDNHKTKLYLRRALRHEATHLAQACNNDKPTGIIKDIEKKIHPNKLKALKASVRISGNLLKEMEAYVMEDKPNKVKKAIEKYCL